MTSKLYLNCCIALVIVCKQNVIFAHALYSGWQKCNFELCERKMAAGVNSCFDSSTCFADLSDYVKSLDSTAKSRYLTKLKYNKGSSSLPDPYCLKNWQNNPSLWPDVTFGDIYTYLIDTPGIYTKESLKAFKSLEAYLYFISGHVKMLWYHSVDSEAPFCFVKGKVIPSQRLNDKAHDAWVCLHKKDASVYCAHCTCMAG